jgi:protocatechuate 3,4-dioxygenase beta subunit
VISRRAALRSLGTALVAAPLVRVIGGCGSNGLGDGSGSDAGLGGDGGAAGGNDLANAAGGWATGGTATMSGDYPDPFSGGLGSACTLTCAATLGPCYASTLVRKDISEGHDGLPVRLAFLVVDESCQPVAGAAIDLWHCAPEGLYSGADADPFCTANDAKALAARWFRGVQVTDAKGRADFDTCFPGWYKSRTIHIHFTIRVDDSEYVTSQLFFDDALDDEIVASQPLYSTRGPRDTTNSTDTVAGSDVASYTFQTQRQADGALLAWKALVIRSSTSETLCQMQGNGGGGPGGPRPDGGPPPG